MAAGISARTPSTIPRPALNIGTIANFFPAKTLHFVLHTGVSISTFSVGRFLVTSYAISIETSETNSLKSFEPVSLLLINANLCNING